MSEKALQLLGLMRRSGALLPGEDHTASCVKAGKARLVLLSSDVSESARRKVEGLCYGRSALLIQLPWGRDSLGAQLGLASCSVAAVSDLGFATAFLERLAEAQPETYKAVAEELQRRRDKAERRRGTNKKRNL